MKSETKILAGIFIASVVILLGGVFLLSKNQSFSPATNNNQVYTIETSTGQKIGSDSAKVKLVEFSDLQCPACRSTHPIVKQVIEKGDPNVQFIYKHYPLPQHVHARAAANAAEAAGEQGKFFEMVDKLFDSQDEWTDLSSPTDYFVKLAQELNLDANKVKEAIEKNQFNDKISQQMSEGNTAGVNATPSFYVNGKKVNLNQAGDLQAAIDQALRE